MQCTRRLIFFTIVLFCLTNADDNSCYPKCVTLSYTLCTICYSNCSSQGFQMKTCEQEYCAQYSSTTNQSGQVTSESKCIRYEKRYLSEKNCAHKCCGFADYNEFTEEKFQQCTKFNQKASIIAFIIVGIIAGVIVVGVLVYFLCCKCGLISAVIGCCQGCVECLCSLGDICQREKDKEQKYKDKSPEQNCNNKSAQISSNEMMKMQHELQTDKIAHFNIWTGRDSKLGKDEQNLNENICSICLGPKANCITDCNHCYHVKCLLQWVKKNCFCPLCISQEYNPVKLICQFCQVKQMKVYITEYTEFSKFQLNDSIPICPECVQIKGKPYFPECEKDLQTKKE